MKIFGLIGAGVVAAGMSLLPTMGSAAACQFGTAADFTLEADVYTSTDCIGALSGNDTGATIGGLDPFGIDDWVQDTKAEREDDDSITYDPTGIMTITMSNDMMMGTWEVSSWDGILNAMLIVKAGDYFAAYLLDISAGLTGGWSTQAIEVGQNNNQPAISHVSLWVSDTCTDPFGCDGGGGGGDVPIPGGLPLLASAAGIGYILRRRKR